MREPSREFVTNNLFAARKYVWRAAMEAENWKQQDVANALWAIWNEIAEVGHDVDGVRRHLNRLARPRA